jgi:hypothetical protein
MKNSSSDTERRPAKQAGKTVPDKPRDCGPHVDTWPILDADAGDTPKPRAQKGGEQQH